jgi:hypothetical protein
MADPFELKHVRRHPDPRLYALLSSGISNIMVVAIEQPSHDISTAATVLAVEEHAEILNNVFVDDM